jgi:hypothetical protein
MVVGVKARKMKNRGRKCLGCDEVLCKNEWKCRVDKPLGSKYLYIV